MLQLGDTHCRCFHNAVGTLCCKQTYTPRYMQQQWHGGTHSNACIPFLLLPPQLAAPHGSVHGALVLLVASNLEVLAALHSGTQDSPHQAASWQKDSTGTWGMHIPATHTFHSCAVNRIHSNYEAAHLDGMHVDGLADRALQPQHNLLGRLCLLVEHWLCLSAIPRLLAVVSPLPCSIHLKSASA